MALPCKAPVRLITPYLVSQYLKYKIVTLNAFFPFLFPCISKSQVSLWNFRAGPLHCASGGFSLVPTLNHVYGYGLVHLSDRSTHMLSTFPCQQSPKLCLYQTGEPVLNGNQKSGWPKKVCSIINHVLWVFSFLSVDWNIDFKTILRSGPTLCKRAKSPAFNTGTFPWMSWNTECLLISFSALGQATKQMSCTNYCGHNIAGQLRNDAAVDGPHLLPKDKWPFYPYVFATILPESRNTLHRPKNVRFLYKSVLSNCLPKKGLYYSLWEISIFDQKCLIWIKCPNFKEYTWFSIPWSFKSPGKLIKRFYEHKPHIPAR